MNNPLAQKYNYYLNESNRLNEELKSEEAYSELLENVLFELLGEEDFTKLFEAIGDHKIGSYIPGVSKHKLGRLEKIAHIARNAAMSGKSGFVTDRALHQLKSHGVNIQPGGLHPDAGKNPEMDKKLVDFGKDKLVAHPSTPAKRNTQRGFQRELSAERRKQEEENSRR